MLQYEQKEEQRQQGFAGTGRTVDEARTAMIQASATNPTAGAALKMADAFNAGMIDQATYDDMTSRLGEASMMPHPSGYSWAPQVPRPADQIQIPADIAALDPYSPLAKPQDLRKPVGPAPAPQPSAPLIPQLSGQQRMDIYSAAGIGKGFTDQTLTYKKPKSYEEHLAKFQADMAGGEIGPPTAGFDSEGILRNPLRDAEDAAHKADFPRRMLAKAMEGSGTAFTPTGLDLKPDASGAISFSDRADNQVGMSNYNLVRESQNALKFGDRTSTTGALQTKEDGRTPGAPNADRLERETTAGADGTEVAERVGEAVSAAVTQLSQAGLNLDSNVVSALTNIGASVAEALGTNTLSVEVTNTPTVSLDEQSLTNLANTLSTANVGGTGADVTTGFDNRITLLESLVGTDGNPIDTRIAAGDDAVRTEIPDEESISTIVTAAVDSATEGFDAEAISANTTAISELQTTTGEISGTLETAVANLDSVGTDINEITGTTIPALTTRIEAAEASVQEGLEGLSEALEPVEGLDETIAGIREEIAAATTSTEQTISAAEEQRRQLTERVQEFSLKITPVENDLRSLSNTLNQTNETIRQQGETLNQTRQTATQAETKADQALAAARQARTK
jgi:hypothetical protein